MGDAELSPCAVEHAFTQEDRERQLMELETLCGRLADTLATHGDPWQAELFVYEPKQVLNLWAQQMPGD